MRIKHWAGYGCVNVRRINDCSMFTLHIRVEGNHEQGLVRDDDYTLYDWLVKRFDPVEKAAPNYPHWHGVRKPIIEIKPGWRTDPVLGVIDTCDYYFTY